MATLNDKTKKNLQAGIDKLGLEGARKKLQEGGVLSGLQQQAKEQAAVGGTTGIQKVQPISSPVAKTGPAGTDLSGLEKAKGYETGQVGIEGINLLKKPPVIGGADTTGGITSPKDDTLPGTEGAGVTGIDGQVTETTGFSDINKDGVINENELTGDYKTFYDTLSDTEKKLFLATGENAMKKNLDITEVYANYMRDYNTVKGRKEDDEAYRLKQQEISGEYTDIQESATMRRAIAGVGKLRQSIAYLGDLGMPGKSSQRMVSIDNQLTEAKTSLDELGKLQSLAKQSRAMGEVKKAQEYEREMEDITTKLNDNIDKSIQDAFNTLIEADNNGQLDTVEELTSFRDKMYSDLDHSITGFSDASISQMRFLVGEVDKARTEAVTYQNNANTVNSEMSVAQGYYVNGNGDPVISATTGTRIDLPAEPPMAPVFDAKTGKLTTFELDEDGQLIGTVQNTYPEATFTEQTIQNYATLVAQGKLDINDVPENVRSNDTFLSSLATTPSKAEEPEITKIGDKSYTYNATTGKYEEVEIAETKIKPSGNVGTVSYTNEAGTTKDVKVDTIAQDDLLTALNGMGGTAIVGEGLRTNERQQELYDAYQAGGGLAAKPGTSKHETGLAIDLYGGEDENGKLLPATAEQVKIMNANGWFQTAGEEDMGHFEYKGTAKEEEEVVVTQTDIMTFNSSTFKPQKDLKTDEQKAKYKQFLDDKKGVMKDKDASMEDILEYSAGGKDLTDTSIKSLEKFDSVINQLGTIQEQIDKMDTGPVLGRLKGLNPYDVDAQTLKAQLTALIPNLARGVYGEVGVLTDNDIRLYSQTIPNLTSTKEVNEAILAMTLKVVSGGYKRQLQSLAAAGKDVSGFAGLYDNLQGQAKALESNLGIESDMTGPEEIAIKEDTLGTTGAGLGAALGFSATPITDQSSDEEITDYLKGGQTISGDSSDEDIINYLTK